MDTFSAGSQRGNSAVSETVFDAVTSRKSVRAFSDSEVPREFVQSILSMASRAPSGTNTQPWRVYVVAGETKNKLSAAILQAHDSRADGHDEEYDYYPTEWREPYLSRRRKVGFDMYGILGIVKGDKEGMHRQHGRNYEFFGAPVGLMFTIDRRLEVGSWLDYGMFLENIMILARGYGLDTCPQQAFAKFHRIIRQYLDIPDDELLMCGMALGYADFDDPVNTLETERVPVQEFARFIDFD